MKRAGADLTVWLIIAIIVVASKIWNRFIAAASNNNASEPKLVPRAARAPARRVVERRMPPPAPPMVEQTGRMPVRDLRKSLDRFKRDTEPRPLATPAMPRPVPVPAREAPKPPESSPPTPAAASAVAADRPSPSAQWAVALRDRQNLRNIIIATEIIGPPRGA